MLIAVAVAAVALQLSIVAASESGEVVVLTTTDDGGGRHATRLWLVENAASTWLRAGAPSSAWLARLRGQPAVTVERGGHVLRFEATPDPAARDAVNALMRAKYGWADRWIALLFGRDDAVPVRLQPAVNAR